MENCQLSFSFGRKLLPARWKAAWEVLLQRHPILRSSLSSRRRSLLEFDHIDSTWNEPDWSTLSREEIGAKWAELQTACRKHVFEPGTSPSWLLHLIALPGGAHHFLWTIHPVLLDEASAAQILLEWVRLYEQLPDGVSAGSWPATPSPSAAVGAIDFAEPPTVSALQQLENPRLESVDPFALLHAPEISSEYETETLQLSSEVAELLERLRLKCSATHDEFLGAVWGYWLASQSATGEALIAARFDLRGHLPPEFEGVQARFETRLPFLASPGNFSTPPASVLPELCKQLRALAKDVFADWQSRANILAARIGNVAVPVTDVAWRTAELNDVLHTAMPMWLDADAKWFEAFRAPLALRAAGQVRVKMRLHVARGFLPPQTPRALLAGFVAFLENLERAPEPARVKTKPASEPAQFRLVSNEPHGIPLEDALRSAGDVPAMLFGTDSYSYSDLYRLGNQLIRFMRRQKIAPETRVLFVMRPTPWMIIGATALLRDGVDFVAMDPTRPPSNLAAFCSEHCIGLVLCDSSSAELFTTTEIKTLPVDTLWEKIGAMPDNDPGARKLPKTSASAFFPCGETLREIPFALLREFLPHNIALHALSPGSRLLLHGTCGQLSTFEEILAATRTGATMVIPQGDIFTTRSAFQEMLEMNAVTHLALDPYRWSNWVHFLAELRTKPPGSLRHLLLETGRMTRKCVEAWESAAGEQIKTTLFYPLGGSRSLAMAASWDTAMSYPIERGIPLGALPEPLSGAAVSNIGRPVPNGLTGRLRVEPAIPFPDAVARTISEILPLDAAPTCVLFPDGIWRATRLPGLQENLAYPLLGRIESAFLAHEEVFDVVLQEKPPGSGKLRAWIVPMDSQGGFPSGLAAKVREMLGGAWEFAEAAVLFKFPHVGEAGLSENDLPPLQPVSCLDIRKPTQTSFAESPAQQSRASSPTDLEQRRMGFVFQEISSNSSHGKVLLVVCEESAEESFARELLSASKGVYRVAILRPSVPGSVPDIQDASAALDALPAGTETRFIGRGDAAWFAARLATVSEKRGCLSGPPILLNPSTVSGKALIGAAGLLEKTLSFLSRKKAAANARRDPSTSRAFRCVCPTLVIVDGEPDPTLLSYFPSAQFFDGDLSSESVAVKAVLDVLQGESAATEVIEEEA